MATKTKHKTHYEMLGVSKDASVEEIRKAYRALAKKYHPDKTGGDKEAEDKLKAINEAYDVLKNKEKRKRYDTELSAANHTAQGFGGAGGFRGFETFDFGGSTAGFDFGDILGAAFGGRRGMGGSMAMRPGRDLEVRVPITLQEVATGAKKRINLTRNDVCPDCRGSGAKAGAQPETCPDCGGAGQLFRGDGKFQSSRACPKCRGLGNVITDPCANCEGTGRAPLKRQIAVEIPAGADSGARIRVAGEGEPGDPGLPRGDLYVTVEVQADPFFKRQGRDLVVEIPVSFAQAAMGAHLTVPTLTGKAKVTLPAGTQSGARLRLRGMGLPDLKSSGKGDLFVQVQVEVPASLTERQEDLLRQFDELHSPDAHPLRNAFARIMGKLRGGSGTERRAA